MTTSRSVRVGLVTLAAAIVGPAGAARAADDLLELGHETLRPFVDLTYDPAARTVDGLFVGLNCADRRRSAFVFLGAWSPSLVRQRLRVTTGPRGDFGFSRQVRLDSRNGRFEVPGPARVEVRGHLRRAGSTITAYGRVRVVSRYPCDARWHVFRSAGTIEGAEVRRAPAG